MVSFKRGSIYIATRWFIVFVLTVTMTGLLQVLNLTPASADTDNGGYPWIGATTVNASTGDFGYYPTCPSNDSNCTLLTGSLNGHTYGEADPWVYNIRNCTSYAAWKVNQQFSVSINGWGNATTWDTKATDAGYTVYGGSTHTPQQGELAQWDNADGGIGHVAYVGTVDSTTHIATLYEYNVGLDGLFYHTRTTASSSAGTPDHYIHIGTVSTPSNRPSAVTRDTSDMDTFYQSGSNLVDRYWNSTNGWNTTYWGVNIASSPAGVARDSSDMDVFFRNSSNNLVDQHWNSSTGWATTTFATNGNMRGDPSVFSPDSSHMSVFYRDVSNNLVDWYWDSTNGWNTTYWSDNLAGSPSAIVRDSNDYDVFFRNTGNNLAVRYWNSSTGWNAAALTTNGHDYGDPGALARGSSDMSAFYKDNSNNLVDEYWNSSTGWSSTYWADNISGTPSAISRTSSNMDVFFRNTGNNLVDRYWSSSAGWNATALDSSGRLTTDPSAIDRDSSDMDAFYGTSPANLVDEYWNSTNGWGSTYWGW